ncbi:MAG: PorV/PorQ family protein [Candidatus Latescibacterota bacterium]
MLRALAVLLLAALARPALAINDNAGTTGFGFLKVGVGARPSALGGAYTAVSGDVESVAWNPAGLVGLRDQTVAVSLSSYLVDTQAGFVSLALPAPDGARVWGLSALYFSYGEMREMSPQGQDLGSFGASDLAAYLSMAQTLWRGWLKVGANLKAVYSSIGSYSSDAYVLDLGVLASGPLEGMAIGASLSNLGVVRRGYAGGHKDSLPVYARLGVSHRPAHTPVPLLLLADLNVPNDNDPYFAFGAEVHLAGGLYVRPGYSMQQTGMQGDQNLGLTAGAGVETRGYRLDYAYSAYPDLGDVHRVSLTGTF